MMILQLPLSDGTVAVHFRLPASIWADKVQVVGDFNDWSTQATPMRLSEQYWEARLILPAGGCYSYAYLIDGADWCTDVLAQERAVGVTPPVSMLPVDIPQVRRRMAAR